MPASTTIISAKNWWRRKASRSAARPFAVCCARPGSARPRNDALPLIASADLPRAREGEMVLLDASLHRWLAARGPQLTLLASLDDATRKVLVAEFFRSEDSRVYFCLLQRQLGRFGVPISFYGDLHSVFAAMTITGRGRATRRSPR